MNQRPTKKEWRLAREIVDRERARQFEALQVEGRALRALCASARIPVPMSRHKSKAPSRKMESLN